MIRLALRIVFLIFLLGVLLGGFLALWLATPADASVWCRLVRDPKSHTHVCAGPHRVAPHGFRLRVRPELKAVWRP